MVRDVSGFFSELFLGILHWGLTRADTARAKVRVRMRPTQTFVPLSMCLFFFFSFLISCLGLCSSYLCSWGGKYGWKDKLDSEVDGIQGRPQQLIIESLLSLSLSLHDERTPPRHLVVVVSISVFNFDLTMRSVQQYSSWQGE